jgi:heparanase
VCNHGSARLCGLLASTWLAAAICSGAVAGAPAVTPSSLPRIGTVDQRFQSYNIEMVEVTGGWFWKPYRSRPEPLLAPPPQSWRGPSPGREDTKLFQYRPPIDLGNARLRKLASALAPAYLRVSGTWANSTYFADADDAPAGAPAGFNSLLTRPQWRGVINFSHAADAEIMTSFAISAGSRDAAGHWTTDQARRLLDYTGAIGGRIVAAEFMNEPDLAEIGGAPEDYDAAKYGRDFRIFSAFVKQAAPDLLIAGPGTTSSATAAADLLAASTPGLDVVSYHHYGALSKRCGGGGKPEAALSEEWLSLTDRSVDFYKTLRDRFEPGKPIWLTETAQAACGGDSWAASFLDTFRYLDQLGRTAKAGVQVIMHNTLAASDYGLLDESTLQPRPNYWGALLWRQLMGTTVLDAGVPLQSGLHVYAHCLRGTPGGVALLVINTDHQAPHVLMLPAASLRYTLDAVDLLDEHVRLNGSALALGAGDELPPIEGAPTSANTLTFEQATITFLAIPDAGNDACR